METVELDTVAGADWIKKGWDFPPYKSKEFLAIVPPEELPAFRKSAAYAYARAQGMIVGDLWAEHYSEPVDEDEEDSDGAP